MPKHVIFLVHGMGDTVPGWSAPAQEKIKTTFALYTAATDHNLEDNALGTLCLHPYLSPKGPLNHKYRPGHKP